MADSSCTEEWRVASRVTNASVASGTRVEQIVLDMACDAGTLLVVVKRDASTRCAWNTVQVGEHEHANFGQKAVKLNHSSSPNTRFQIEEKEIHIIATRLIASNTALTFNYNTTEWLMDEPFLDWTSGEHVQGFSKASAAEQRRLLDDPHGVAPHIRSLAERTLPLYATNPRMGLRTTRTCGMAVQMLRLLPGEDLVESLRRWAAEEGVAAACVISAVGSTGKTTLRPAGVSTAKVLEGKHEILSFSGTVSRDSHHLQLSVSDDKCQMYGGHALAGCVVRTTAELCMGIIEGVRFNRPLDARTGYDELHIEEAEEATGTEGRKGGDMIRCLVKALQGDGGAAKRPRVA